jgi:hypothetical protein
MQHTNLQPPGFGPKEPTYPVTGSICRITGPSIGNNVYPAFAQQISPPLALRDREPVYLWEPSGTILAPGYYFCRLMSSYNGLPLYVFTAYCCSQPPPPVPPIITSSSSSPGGGGGACIELSASNCCPGNCIPSTLCLTFSGQCACLNGTYTLTYIPSLMGWALAGAECGGVAFDILFYCSENGWLLTFEAQNGSGLGVGYATSYTCTPGFSATGIVSVIQGTSLCLPGETINWVVSDCNPNSGAATTACCGGTTSIPSTLYLTLDTPPGLGGESYCSVMNTTVALVYAASGWAGAAWYGTISLNTGSVLNSGMCNLSFALTCSVIDESNFWSLSVQTSYWGTFSTETITAQCSPFFLSGSLDAGSDGGGVGCCGDSVTLNFNFYVSTGIVTSSSSGASAIYTPCCPAVSLPAVLHVTVSGQTGTCNWQNFTLTYNGANWLGLDNNGLLWTLSCSGSTCMQLALGASHINAAQGLGCTCSPFNLVYTVATTAGSGCTGAATFTITR